MASDSQKTYLTRMYRDGVGEVVSYSVDNVKGLLAAQSLFLKNAESFYFYPAHSWTAGNGHKFFGEDLGAMLAKDESAGDYIRLWNIYQSFHIGMANSWKKELGLSSRDPPTDDTLKEYQTAFLNKNVGASISEAQAKELFSSSEIKKAEGLRSIAVVLGNGPWKDVTDYFTDEKRAASPRAFEKYLIQHLICRMLCDNLVDHRNIAYQKKFDVGEQKNIPSHFEKKDERGKNIPVDEKATKARIEKRTKEMKKWLDHFNELPYTE